MLRSLLNPDYESVTTEEVNLGDNEPVQFGPDSDHVRIEHDGNNLRFFDESDDNAGLQVQGGKTFIYPGASGGIKINVQTSSIQLRDRVNILDNVIEMTPQDVRNISSPSEGWYADHDGSGSNTAGLARYNGTDWISQVDGSTIA